MSFPRYADYKQSSLDWVPEIPAHWQVLRLKRVLAQRIADGPHTTPAFLEEGVPFLSVDAIQDGELVFEECRFVSAVDHAEYRAKAAPRRDDLLMGKAASTGKVARVKVDVEFSIWSPLALIRVDRTLANPVFTEYMLKSATVQAQIDNYCTANTQKNISMDDIPRLLTVSPPIAEQLRIAAFLDGETAKIDALITEQQRLIELLKEKRQAVISHAVTRGLNPDAPMKPSGVEWIGEVPIHWEVGAIKHFLKHAKGAIKTGPFGSHLTTTEMQGGPIKVYTQRNVIDSDFTAGEHCISEEKFSELKAFEAFPGDLLVTTRGTIGRAAILPAAAGVGILHPCLLRIQPDSTRVQTVFLATLIQDSELVRLQLAYQSNATTIEVIYSDTMASVIIPVPPVDEQSEIMSFVMRESDKVAALIGAAREAVALLKERRAGLISAAVTGKIDVRNYVPDATQAA